MKINLKLVLQLISTLTPQNNLHTGQLLDSNLQIQQPISTNYPSLDINQNISRIPELDVNKMKNDSHIKASSKRNLDSRSKFEKTDGNNSFTWNMPKNYEKLNHGNGNTNRGGYSSNQWSVPDDSKYKWINFDNRKHLIRIHQKITPDKYSKVYRDGKELTVEKGDKNDGKPYQLGDEITDLLGREKHQFILRIGVRKVWEIKNEIGEVISYVSGGFKYKNLEEAVDETIVSSKDAERKDKEIEYKGYKLRYSEYRLKEKSSQDYEYLGSYRNNVKIEGRLVVKIDSVEGRIVKGYYENEEQKMKKDLEKVASVWSANESAKAGTLLGLLVAAGVYGYFKLRLGGDDNNLNIPLAPNPQDLNPQDFQFI